MNNGQTILIVDDDINMTHTLVDILTLKEYSPLEANSVAQALEIINQQKIDCVLSDVRMSHMDGVALYEILERERPDLPVILMTAYATDEIVDRGQKSGIIGVFEKPLNIPFILEILSVLSHNKMVIAFDNDPEFFSLSCNVFLERGIPFTQFNHWQKSMFDQQPDTQIVLLNFDFDSPSGLSILDEMLISLTGSPLILITNAQNQWIEMHKLALQTINAKCLYKPVEIAELLRWIDILRFSRIRKEISKRPL